MDTNIKKFDDRYLTNPNYYGTQPSTLFQRTKDILKEHFRRLNISNPKILEVGAGQGRDSIALAKLFPESKVYCTDGSDSAIKTAEQNIQSSNLSGRVITGTQDVFSRYEDTYMNTQILFANMCLHYHKDDTSPTEFVNETLNVFKYAISCLTASGLFVFAVNSDKDEYFGKGEEIGEKSGVWKYDDRIRHFFTESFINDILMTNGCKLIFIDHIGEYYDPNLDRLQQYYIVVAEKI